MTPTELMREWLRRFNAVDIEGLTQLYAENAVNDQAVFSAPLVGRKAIRELLETVKQKKIFVTRKKPQNTQKVAETYNAFLRFSALSAAI